MIYTVKQITDVENVYLFSIKLTLHFFQPTISVLSDLKTFKKKKKLWLVYIK